MTEPGHLSSIVRKARQRAGERASKAAAAKAEKARRSAEDLKRSHLTRNGSFA